MQVRSTFLGLIGCAILTVTLASCKRATPPPPPPRNISLSVVVNSPAGPKPIMNANVAIVPYDKGREKLIGAMVKRRKIEEQIRKEEAELEKIAALSSGTFAGDDAPPGAEASIQQAVQGAKTTLFHLADRALIYFDGLLEKKAASPERLENFRKKLGVDEIKQAANRISSKSRDDTRKVIGEIREILQRDVYEGREIMKDRDLALETLKTLESRVQKQTDATPPPTANDNGGKLSRESLRDRLLALEALRIQARDTLPMFTALPDTKFKGQTDGSGRCSLTIPPDGRWLIAVSQQQTLGVLTEALGISKSDCWIQEIKPGVTQLNLTDDNALQPAVAPLGLEQEFPWK